MSRTRLIRLESDQIFDVHFIYQSNIIDKADNKQKALTICESRISDLLDLGFKIVNTNVIYNPDNHREITLWTLTYTS